MISEGSCDTKNWSNECWIFNFAIKKINYILKYFQIENIYFKYYIIFVILLFYSV